MSLLNSIMSFLKQVYGYVSGFFTWIMKSTYLIEIMVVLIVLFLIALLIYYIRKRRKAEGEQKEITPAVKQKKQPKGLRPSSLAKIWKGFLKKIPWAVRPSVTVYEHFIVFGEDGAGKSALIDNYTDWQGYARQFYPSYTMDPLLQIYLGSKVLVQEIPFLLLDDISFNARHALLKLWKPLFKRKDPTVVIVLNGGTLQTDDPEYLEQLKQMAQKIRGKINLLSRICKKPIKIRLVLTHMDQFEGFLEFSQFLTRNDISSKLEFSTQADLSDVSRCLEQYEEHLPRALTSLPADEYLKTITFLRQAPKSLQRLAVFNKFLTNPDPLSLDPEVTSLYLTSYTDGNTPALNPFAPSLTAEELQEFDPLFKHRVAAVAIGMAGLVYLGAAYFYERSLVNERYQAIAAVKTSPPVRYDQKMHELFPAVYLQQHSIMKFLPDFFPQVNREMTRLCIDNIRKFYLFPALERSSMQAMAVEYAASDRLISGGLDQQYGRKTADSQDKILCLLALIYANRNNELGEIIHNNMKAWKDILKIPDALIVDYIQNNESSWPVTLDTNKITYRPSKSIADDPREWMVYFSEVDKISRQPIITKAEFEALQKKADHFLGIIEQLDFNYLSIRIDELLKKESVQTVHLDLMANRDSQIRQQGIKNFLLFIKKSSMNYPEVTNELRLADLYENLKVMLLNPKGIEGEIDLPFQFVLSGQEYKFYVQQWKELLSRSRTTLFLRDFISYNKRQDGRLFFSAEKEFEDLVMNASNHGQFLFIGHARVDGRFTKEAVEKRVRPILTELPAFVDKLAIPLRDKSSFSNFLLKEVDAYGRSYAQYYRKFYMEFDIKADSPGALRFVLSQMVLPSSPFMEVLLTMRENTQIDAGKNEYLQSLTLKLSEFEFLKRLMGEQKGSYPELDKYRALLGQMQMDMQEQQAFARNKDKEETFTALKSQLTPLGKIGFAIFNGDKDSYLNLVKLWLDSVGIPHQWQDIFLAPVWQAYFLGMTEIQTTIGKIWGDLRQADIYPLYGKFPFEAISGEDVTIEALRNATHPSGHFWQTFQRTLTPFCFEEDGRWRRRAGLYDVPKLPDHMLQTVNAVASLSNILWDKEGRERPLEFMIRPGQLPQALPQEPIATLSYLQAGESSVFGFNQKPSWQKFKINWQTPGYASVGVELTTRDKSPKIKKTIDIPASYWSFFHLLQEMEKSTAAHKLYDTAKGVKAAGRSAADTGGNKKAEASHVLTWVINLPAANVESRPLNIIFNVQGNPWTLFELPR